MAGETTNHVFQKAARYPQIPMREHIAEDEVAAYDFHAARTELFRSYPGAQLVDGVPYGVAHFEAMLVSPPVAWAISGPQGVGTAVLKTQDAAGSYTRADHELIDCTLAFDSGYWALVAGHTPWAIEAGVRIECLKALARGEEEKLTDDERQVVEFIRAVRDGGVTDGMYAAIKDRFGSDRGVIDYISHILLLFWHHRFCWAVGAPEVRREDWWKMIEEFEDGTRSIEDYKARTAAMLKSREELRATTPAQ